jgi:tape measure domain-containing protein
VADQQIASVSLQAVLDWTKFDRDLESLSKRSLPKIHLTATVDDRRLTELNKHLDLKENHVKRLQRSWDSNPLTIRTELRELTQARTELQSFNRELRDIRSQVGTKIQLEAEHKINIARLENALEKSVDRFEKVGDTVGKKISDRLSKTKVQLDHNTFSIGGIFSGVMQGITYAIGQKIAAGTSGRFDARMAGIGRSTERYVSTRTGRAATYAARDLGYEDSRQMRKDIARIGSFVDSFIHPTKSRESGERFEKAMSNAVSNAFVKQQPKKQVAKQFLQDAFEPSTGAQEAGLRLGGFALRKASPLIRLNKDFQLSKARSQAEEMAKQMQINQDQLDEMRKATAVVFAIGGMYNDGGNGAANSMKPVLQNVMPGAFIQPVQNKFTDTNRRPKGIDNFLDRIKPGLNTQVLSDVLGLNVPLDLLKQLDLAAFSGISEDAIRAAAQIKALRDAGLEKPIYSLGFSAGGSESSDIVRLAEMLGTPIKGVGLGSPINGLAQRPTRDFLSVIGQEDHLYKQFFKPNKIQGNVNSVFDLASSGMLGYALSPIDGAFAPKGVGQGHLFQNYVGSRDVQQRIGSFLPGTNIENAAPWFQNGKRDFSARYALNFRANDESVKQFRESLGAIPDYTKFDSDAGEIDRIIGMYAESIADLKKQFGKAKGDIKEEIVLLEKSAKQAIAILETLKTEDKSGIDSQVKKLETTIAAYDQATERNREIERTGYKPKIFNPQIQPKQAELSIAQSFQPVQAAQSFNPQIQPQNLVREIRESQNEIRVQSSEIEKYKAKVGILSKGIQQAEQLVSARPVTAQDYLKSLNNELPEITNAIDKLINTLEPEQRLNTIEGNQLSNLKSQVAKIEQRINELNIDSGRAISNVQGIPNQGSVRGSIKSIGNEFSAQLKSAKSLGTENPKSIEIAQEIVNAADVARNAIDQLLSDLGGNADVGMRKIASTAKGQITRSERAAKQYVTLYKKDGQDFGAGINAGLSQSIGTVEKNASAIAKAGTEAIKKEWQIRSPSRVGQYLGRMLGVGVNQGLDQTIAGVEQYASGIKNNLTNTFQGITTKAKAIAGVIVAITALNSVLPIFDQLTQATLQTGLEFEALERRLSLVEGGADQGAERLRSLKSQSDELGLSFRESAESYANLAATTRDTPLQGFQTEQIAESLNILGSAYNFDRNRQNRFNVGFTQVLGKGKVSQEEIRQQLAEAAPGFTQLAARSYGVDVPELNRMITAGVDSQDFAVRVSQQIRAELGGASDEGAKSAQGSINRLENSIAQLQGTVGKGILPGVAIGSEAAAFAINALASNIDKLLALLTAATFTAATFGAQGLFELIRYNGGLLATFKALVPSIVSFRSALSATLPIVGRFAAVLAAMGAFNIIKTALSDASGEFGNFADSAEKSMKKYEDALSKANGTQKDFIKSLPQNTSDVKGKSWLESVPLIDMLPQDWVRNFENLTIKGAQESSNPLNIFRFIPKRAEKENRDQMNALDRFLGINTVDRVNDQLSGKQNGLSQLQTIDRQLEQVRTERGAIAARRTDLNQRDPRLDALRSREQELLKQRETYIAPTGALQAELASRIETLEKAQEALSEMSQEGAITQDQYATQTKRVSDELAKAKSAQDSFNSAMRDSLSKMGAFERNMRSISDRSEDNQRSIQLRSEASSVNIANAELTGSIDRGTADSANQTAQQMALREQINEQRSQLAKMMAELQAQDAAKIFSQFGVTETTGVNELKTLIENTQGDREKKLLESLMQVRELEGKISQSEAQLGQQFVQTKRAIDDSNRAVVDYYRSIERQTKDLTFELQSMQLDTKLAGIKNSITASMNGFYSTFVDEFANNIIGVIETASGKARSQIEALQQIQQRLNAAEDVRLQGEDLKRGLPGAIDFMSSGGSSSSATQAPVGSKIAGDLRVTNRNDPDGSGYGFDYGVWEGGDDRGVGAPVAALAGGRVVEIRRNDSKYGMGGQRGFGNQVYIRVMNPATGQESDVAYGHLNEINVTEGETVGRGQRIGTQGETGSATAPHVTLNVFAKGASGGGAAEVALGKLLEQSIDRGVYANAGNIRQQQRSNSLAPSNQQYRLNPNQAAGSGQPLFTANGASRSPSQSSQNRIGSVGGFDANRINRSVAILQQQGLSPLAAAMLTGSFMQESGGAGWEKADNGTHRGIMQWSKGVRDRGLPSDFGGQVAFAIREGMQDSPDSIRTLKNPSATREQVEQAIRNMTRYGPGEEKSRFQYGAEIYKQMGGSSARPMNPTTGMTNEQLQYNQMIANNNAIAETTINAAGQQALQNAQQANQAALDRAGALGKLAETQAANQLNVALKSFNTGLRDQERQVIEAERKLADLRRSSQEQTPFVQLQTSLLQLTRQQQDEAKTLNQDYEKVTETLFKSRALLETMQQSDIVGKEPIVKSLQSSIPELERQQRHLEQVRKEQDKTYSDNRAFQVNKFFQEISRGTETIALSVAEFRDQMGITTAFEKHRTEIDRLKQSQIEFHRSYEQTLPSLEEFAKSDLITDEQRRQAQERIDLIRKSAEEYDRATQRAIEFKKAMFANDQLQASLGRDRQLIDSNQARQTAELGFLRYDGAFGGFERAEREAEIARQNQAFELQKGYADLQRLAITDPEMSPERLGLMRTNLERLNEVKLTNISLEVQTLGNVMRDELVSQFTDGFTSILTGAQSFSEGFGNILKNLGNKLISMGLNSLFSRVFGSIFNGTMPMNTGQIGGSVGGFVGNLVSSLIPKFSEGGIIGEGRSPVDNQLILAQRGEAVITHRGVDLLGARAIDLINEGMLPRFANGGMISGGMMPNARSGMLPRMKSAGGRSVTHKIETVLVGGQEFVTIDQFRSAIEVVNRRSEMNAENAVTGHVESLQSSPGYRSSLGMG